MFINFAAYPLQQAQFSYENDQTAALYFGLAVENNTHMLGQTFSLLKQFLSRGF